MNSETNETSETTVVETVREAWATPKITSFDAVSVTQSNTLHPGDALNSNS
jgi:hypothetical protein